MSDTLFTERLALRPISPGDAPDLFEVYSDPRAMRFMPSLPHRDVVQTEAELTRATSLNGAYAWAVCFKGSDRPLGCVNFLGEVPVPGMGYILHPDFWGQGLIPEACRVVLGFGFERLGYERVELWIDEDNFASQRVAHKLGFKLRGQLPLKYNHQTVHHVMLVFGLTPHEEDPAARFFRLEPVLQAADVEKAASYYRDVLGFWVDFLYGSPATHAGVSRGGWSGGGVSIQLTQVPPNQPVSSSGSLHILVGTGLDALFELYRQRGVAVVSAPVSRPWGMRDFRIRDCNGHLLTFATHL